MNGEIYLRALKAVICVASDPSVDQAQAIRNLESLREEINTLLSTSRVEFPVRVPAMGRGAAAPTYC